MPAPGASSSSRNGVVAMPCSALLSLSLASLLLASLLLASLLLLGGCATSHSGRDGPGANPPPNLARIADAEPVIEPIRSGGANKPYQALGRDYVPITRDVPFSERGLASWYGRAFQGKRTASGEPYDMYAMTAAHRIARSTRIFAFRASTSSRALRHQPKAPSIGTRYSRNQRWAGP